MRRIRTIAATLLVASTGACNFLDSPKATSDPNNPTVASRNQLLQRRPDSRVRVRGDARRKVERDDASRARRQKRLRTGVRVSGGGSRRDDERNQGDRERDPDEGGSGGDLLELADARVRDLSHFSAPVLSA